jgi:hypothetical protein
MSVAKSGRRLPSDPLIVAALAYAHGGPTFQAAVRKALAACTPESRRVASRALSQATAAALRR